MHSDTMEHFQECFNLIEPLSECLTEANDGFSFSGGFCMEPQPNFAHTCVHVVNE